MTLKGILNYLNKYYPLFFTIIFIILLTQYSFSSLEAIFYDLRIKSDFATRISQDIVMVTLDEESDQFLGEVYPYTYASHNRLLKNIIDDNPKAIGYLVNLNEPEFQEEEKDLQDFKSLVDKFQESGGGFRFGTNMDSFGEQLPPPQLRELGYSLALLNQDSNSFARDEVTRRAILNISGEDSFHFWLANFYRKKKGLEVLNTNTLSGAYYVPEADATFALYRFGGSPVDNSDIYTQIPFHKIAVGNMPSGFFKDKVVLIGSKYISNYDDFILTPYNKEKLNAPRLNIHGLIIDALVQAKTVAQVPRAVSSFISILLAFFLSIVIFRVNPTKGLMITLLTIMVVVFIAFSFFNLFGMWIYLVHIILSIFIVYYICVPFRAIQEYQIRYAIQEESKIIKKVDRLKQNFISLMSHDLKTPVARISGIADILRTQHSLNPDQSALVFKISEATKELNKFITSILDLTKIESRNLTLTKESKDVNKLIEAVINQLKFDANHKNIAIEKDLSPLYPIEIDTTLINRVISNLVENAIKYSGEGTKVHLKSWDDDKWVYIEVKDNGKGIPSEDLDHIFDKFYRVKNDESHKVKGSGLGLYLVKYFVELHEGTIEASSVVGEGTTFMVKLKNQ